MTLTQIAATPAPSQPRTHARTTSELALMRLVLYPILFLILIFALWFAWGRVFGSAAAGSGQNIDKSGKLNDSASDNSKTGGPAGEHPERGIGNNNNGAGANMNIGNSGNNSNNNNSEINNPAAGENGASSAQNSPAGGERIQVLRIAAYPDSPDGLEIANATVSKLRELGFTDARAVRVAKDKEGKRFEIVLLAGRGDSARDPDLIRLGERIRALPPFTPGQSKKHPFDDALIVRQPEADATAGAR